MNWFWYTLFTGSPKTAPYECLTRIHCNKFAHVFKRKVIVRGLSPGEHETGIMCTGVFMRLYLYVMYKTDLKPKNYMYFLMVKITVQIRT